MKLVSPELKAQRLFIAIASAILAVSSHAQTPGIPGNWTLTFNDDFNNAWLDGTRWRLGEHWAGMAGVGALSPANVTVSGGTLKLKTENTPLTQFGVAKSYRSAEVSTFFQFRQQYGYFEARIKYPAVTGLWPAFWFMPDRASYGTRENYRQSYLKFDLTNSGITTVTSATLRLKVSGVQTSGTNHFTVMKLGDDTWTESTLTWNNKPAPNPVWLASHWNKVTSVDQEINTDATVYLQQQFSSGDKKISFVVADTYMKAQLVKFYSSEAATTTSRPKLIVNGQTFYATEDSYVSWGANANTNYGSATELLVKDEWGDTATTFNGGMEIDVMESLGIWGANKIQHATHWDGYDAQHQSKGWPNVISPATGDSFHRYGVYWQPNLVEFYVDGVRTGSWSDARVMSVPAYLILSLQLGGWDNNNAGSQVNNQVMEVDWVRAWSGTRTGLNAMVVDNTETARVVATGTWTASTTTGGYFSTNYTNDGNTGKGTKSFSFKPPITASGNYQVYCRWTSDTNRASNVPVDIVKSNGTVSTVTVNQQTGGSQWNLLGTYALAPSNAEVRIRTNSTNGYVIADAVRVVPAP